MPSVRDILKGVLPQKPPAANQQGTADDVSTNSAADLSPDLQQNQNDAVLIADRIRQAAEQRAALAQSEITRLQLRLDQLKEHMGELQKQNLPQQEVQKSIDQVSRLLDDARSDLARAQEAKLNVGFATGPGQGKREDKGLQHDHQQEGPGAKNVRAALGGKIGVPPKHDGSSKIKL